MAKHMRHRDVVAATVNITRLAIDALVEGDTREAGALLGYLLGLAETQRVTGENPVIVQAVTDRAARRITIARFVEILTEEAVI